MTNVEKRYVDVEVRTTEADDAMVIEGYALKFNTESNPMSGGGVRFIETISPEALVDADMSDVRALIDHNPSMILARTTAETLKLTVDDIGLHFRAVLADTTYARDLYQNIQAGNINQCSFAFKLKEKGDAVRFNKETHLYERTLNAFSEILDVSAVTYPAYNDTDVAPALRSIESLTEETEALQTAQKRKLALTFDLMKMRGARP